MKGFIPYTKSINREDNMNYRFLYQGTDQTPYDITITIDELDDDLIIKKTCTCPSFLKFRKGEDCKHIKEAKEILKNFGVSFREDEL